MRITFNCNISIRSVNFPLPKCTIFVRKNSVIQVYKNKIKILIFKEIQENINN